MNRKRLSILLSYLVVLIAFLPPALAVALPLAQLPPPEPPSKPWMVVKFNQIHRVLLSPDGKRVAVYYRRPTCALVLYDRTTGKEIHRFDQKLTPNGSFSMLFTPDSTRLITAHARSRVPVINEAWVWDVRIGKLLHVIPFRQRQYIYRGPNQLDISDKLLVVSSEDDVAGVYDLATGNDLGVIAGDHRTTAMALSRDGRWLFTSGRDETLRLWDVQKRKLMHTLKGTARALAFSPDGAWCASVSENRELRVFSRASGREKASTNSGLWRLSYRLLFSPDGKTLVTVGHGLNFGLRVWDWQSSAKVRGDDCLCKTRDPARGTKPTEGAIEDATMASDGTLLVWGFLGLELWDLGLSRATRPERK